MKNNLKQFISSLTLGFVLLAPTSSFAEGDPILNISGDITVTQITDQYSVHATLHGENIGSLSNLSFIGVVDQDEINPPYAFAQVLPISNFNTATGNFDTNFVLNFNPTAYAFQFYFVDNQSFAASGGINLFNPANNGTYLTFVPTSVYWYQLPDTPFPNGTDPNAGTINCDLPEFASLLECQNQPTTPNQEFNPNYTFTSHLINPLGEGNNFDIFGFLEALFNNILKIAIPFLVMFMIYSGFLFVSARGDTEKLATARTNFLYVIIGALLILGAWTIAHILKGTVDQFEAMNFISNFINLV